MKLVIAALLILSVNALADCDKDLDKHLSGKRVSSEMVDKYTKEYSACIKNQNDIAKEENESAQQAIEKQTAQNDEMLRLQRQQIEIQQQQLRLQQYNAIKQSAPVYTPTVLTPYQVKQPTQTNCTKFGNQINCQTY